MFGAWLSMMTEAASTTAAIAVQTKLTDLPLVTRGLLTTLFGLVGVFLVLLLFFFSIKLMQNLGKRKETPNE